MGEYTNILDRRTFFEKIAKRCFVFPRELIENREALNSAFQDMKSRANIALSEEICALMSACLMACKLVLSLPPNIASLFKKAQKTAEKMSSDVDEKLTIVSYKLVKNYLPKEIVLPSFFDEAWDTFVKYLKTYCNPSKSR